MPREHALNFDQWETFSQNYKPMRVLLWFVYEIIENDCRSSLFTYSFVPNCRGRSGEENTAGGKLSRFLKTTGVVFRSFSYNN